MISSSLLLKMSVPYRNRTYNRVLGGPRYIHLTKGTNAVFSGFFSLLATVTISMNPITSVMNFYCNLFWHPGQFLLESNSDLSLLKFQRCQPWLNLRRQMLYPAELHEHDSFSSNIITSGFDKVNFSFPVKFLSLSILFSNEHMFLFFYFLQIKFNSTLHPDISFKSSTW